MLVLFRTLNSQYQLLYAANRCTFNTRDEEEKLLLLGQRELTDNVLYHHQHHQSHISHASCVQHK